MPELMKIEEQFAQQNEAIRALSAGLLAIVEELHAAGALHRENVAARLNRLRNGDGSPIPTVEAVVQLILQAEFADCDQRERFGVIEGGKSHCDLSE